MKKTIAIILSLTLLMSACVVGVSAASSDVDISYAVASDLHYNIPDEELEWFSEDPIYGYANRRAAMENESGLIIDEMLRQVAEDDNMDFLLVAGDLADNGKSTMEEHLAVAEKLKNFEEASGKQVYVIPGNHDYGMPGEYCETGATEFKNIYADFGYDQAITTDGLSYTANLGNKHRLIALDSTDPNKSTEDGMTDAKVQWVIDEAQKAYDDGRYPILMMHHNLLDHMPLQRVLSHDFIIRNHTATATKWADAGIKLVFTGHEHCSDATTYTSPSGNTISDFATTSLTMYPLEYRYVEMSEDTITYEAKTIDSIDTDALVEMVDGYSDEQIAEMNKGLNAFAKEYLKNGVEYRLERGFNDEQLGIKPGDFYYTLVRDVVDTFNDVLNMPLYGEGSAQELAKQYNIDIPESDYKDGWDVATSLVAAHYAGEEDYPLYENDVKILFLIMSLVIKSEFDYIDDQTFYKAAASVIAAQNIESVDAIIKMISAQEEGVTAGEYLLVAVASPLLHSFANDDGVPDNNGAIDGYGNTDTGANIGANLGTSFLDVANGFYTFLRYIVKILNLWL
ncbi:MAG: metallophosphoesterase [Clostridia bacterium]|nr:metallophosphoesterase [Clostridia bacterium]